ncbi:MAG: modification methylase, partial [Chloroflexi bacterium]|nr:modification methylase [Chloroflexota bacterium]
DNYDAIEVSKTKEIPYDWPGAMGVPISFLDKHNPGQFEIIGMDRPLITELTGKVSRFWLNGTEKYARIVIRNKRLQA